MIIPIWIINLLLELRQLNPGLDIRMQPLGNQVTVFCSDKIPACTDVSCPEGWTIFRISMSFEFGKSQGQSDTVTIQCYRIQRGEKNVLILTSKQKAEIDLHCRQLDKVM